MSKEPCKAFVLAAGLGTRLRPLTEQVPKCLLPIGGIPLLQIWLEHLARQGVGEVLVNTHWRHEKVQEFLETWGGNQQVAPFYEPRLLGSAGTILANRHWVEDGSPFLIIYGDNLTNVDLRKMLAFHRSHGLPFTLGVFRSKIPKQCGIAAVEADGLVTGFVEKPQEPRSDLAAAGVYVADRRIFDFFPEVGPDWQNGPAVPLDLGFHVIPRLVGRMKAYLIKEFLMDIGTLGQYDEARAAWPKGEL
ncbi:MAG TPA: nucleotidyl transferase [Desulfobacterales bacterium]|nr:nucleotidyl transferase [Desulfobacterales bacterium]